MTEKLLELLKEKRYKKLKAELQEFNSVDLADFMDELPMDETLIIFRMMPKDVAVEVFSYISIERQKEIINSITDKEIKHIIDELFFDDMIDLLEEMPANVVKKILKNAKEEERILINHFLNYPDNSAGSIMTIEYVDLKKNMTVRQAIEHIKKIELDKETIYNCYITNPNRRLEGIISLRRLVTSDDEQLIEDIMNTDVIFASTHDDQEEVANLFKKYDLIALPVVDKENRLTGIITIDDIVDVIEDENTEDFEKMAGLQPSETEYLDTNVFSLAKHRIVWLLVLMISATFTGRIIQSYENVLQSVVILAAFIPMLMDTGGNAGAQSSTLIIRGLALGEIKTKDFLRVIFKEFSISVLVGLSLATVNFIRILVFENVDIMIAFTVNLTLLVTVVTAKLVGGALPIVAIRFKVDPAIMASPLITTIVDAISLVVYFYLASLLLGL